MLSIIIILLKLIYKPMKNKGKGGKRNFTLLESTEKWGEGQLRKKFKNVINYYSTEINI